MGKLIILAESDICLITSQVEKMKVRTEFLENALVVPIYGVLLYLVIQENVRMKRSSESMGISLFILVSKIQCQCLHKLK